MFSQTFILCVHYFFWKNYILRLFLFIFWESPAQCTAVWLFRTIRLLVRLILRFCCELTDEVFKFTLAVLYNCFCIFCILSLGSLLLILSYFFILFILLFYWEVFTFPKSKYSASFHWISTSKFVLFFHNMQKEINSLAVMERRHFQKEQESQEKMY